MADPFSVSVQTIEQQAARALSTDPAPEHGRERVEQLLFRTGRPVPNVLVLEDELAMRCRQVDELGGAAVGIAPGPNSLKLALARYPGGQIQQGDVRKLPVEKSSFDAVWAGEVYCRFARGQMIAALQSARDVLRPGGLLHMVAHPGDSEGFIETAAGRIYRTAWNPDALEQAVGALDFSLLEARAQDGEEVAMIFRREY